MVAQAFLEFDGKMVVRIPFEPFQFLKFVTCIQQKFRFSPQRDFGADGRIQQHSAVRAARQCKRVAGSAAQVGRNFAGWSSATAVPRVVSHEKCGQAACPDDVPDCSDESAG